MLENFWAKGSREPLGCSWFQRYGNECVNFSEHYVFRPISELTPLLSRQESAPDRDFSVLNDTASGVHGTNTRSPHDSAHL